MISGYPRTEKDEATTPSATLLLALPTVRGSLFLTFHTVLITSKGYEAGLKGYRHCRAEKSGI